MNTYGFPMISGGTEGKYLTKTRLILEVTLGDKTFETAD